MKRKLMAMTLALMMVLPLAITVSAASSSYTGTYDGYYYEAIDTCNTYNYNSKTIYDSSDYSIYSDVSLNTVAKDEDGNSVVVTFMTVNGNPSYLFSTTSGTSAIALSSIYCVHYINGSNVYSAKVYPG